ncbi:hypothetical protein AHAS_Ahas20G0206500 [Arachis hypogaea]
MSSLIHSSTIGVNLSSSDADAATRASSRRPTAFSLRSTLTPTPTTTTPLSVPTPPPPSP